MKLNNKFAIITGASTGIGQAIAIEFANEGAIVALVARSTDKLEKTKEIIETNGGKAEVFTADLADIQSILKLVHTIMEKTARVDILANVAGIWHGADEVYAGKNIEEMTDKVVTDTLTVGTIAPILLAKNVIPLMTHGGNILNLSGTFSEGGKGWLPYYVSKRAIEDMTIGLADDLRNRKNIQVNCISPSDTATEEYKKYFPEYIDEAVDPKKIALFAVDLCSSPTNIISGKTFVIKKNQKPFEGFHL